MASYTSATLDQTIERLATPLTHPAEDLVDIQEAAGVRALLAATDSIELHRAGERAIVTPDNDYVGDHKEYVLAPFSAPAESRFSDGSYGVLYAGFSFDTAREEVLHWLTKEFANRGMPSGAIAYKQHLDMRLVADVADVRRASGGIASIYDPDSYSISHEWGREIRAAGFAALWYDSVRYGGGECAGVFVPRVVSNVRLGDRLEFTWDGTRFADLKRVTSL